MIQLDFFQAEEKDSREILRELQETKELARLTAESAGKVRRGIFARHGELSKLYLDLHQRLEILERHICNGK